MRLRIALFVVAAGWFLAAGSHAIDPRLPSHGFQQPASAAMLNFAPAESVEAKLKKVTSLTLPDDTLENAINFLAEDIGVKVTIRGSDLQIDGITRNQRIVLNEENKPAADILKTILKKANLENKLVYVIVKNKAGEEEIYITTRAAAAQNKWKLPADLVIKK